MFCLSRRFLFCQIQKLSDRTLKTHHAQLLGAALSVRITKTEEVQLLGQKV